MVNKKNQKMNTNKITAQVIIDSIDKMSEILVKKHELYENVKLINSELKNLYESAPPMVGSFGFKTDNDAAKNISGFVDQPNISYIAKLESEMNEEGSTTLNEVEVLQKENEKLKKELEELKLAQKKG